MKLMQLNIWMGRLLPQIIRLIEAEQPDIICMQEVFHGPVAINTLDHQLNNLRDISEAIGYTHEFFAPTLGFTLNNQSLEFGNAILSRFPLLNQQTIFTSGAYQSQTDVMQTLPNVRNLQITHLEINGKRLTLANHHGFWLRDPLGNEETIASLKIVADSLRNQSTPLILAGDFNVIPESPAMRVFDGFLEDLTATYRLTDTLSELGKAKNVPCDHILVSPEVTVESFRVSDALVSDHLALVLEFTI